MKYKIVRSIFGKEDTEREGLSKEEAEKVADTLNRGNPYIVYRVVRQ